MKLNIGDRVKRSDVTEQSIPAFKNLRGKVVAFSFEDGRYFIHWDGDRTPDSLSRDSSTICKDEDKPKKTLFQKFLEREGMNTYNYVTKLGRESLGVKCNGYDELLPKVFEGLKGLLGDMQESDKLEATLEECKVAFKNMRTSNYLFQNMIEEAIVYFPLIDYSSEE